MSEIYTLQGNVVINLEPVRIPFTHMRKQWGRRKNLKGILITAIATVCAYTIIIPYNDMLTNMYVHFLNIGE